MNLTFANRAKLILEFRADTVNYLQKALPVIDQNKEATGSTKTLWGCAVRDKQPQYNNSIELVKDCQELKGYYEALDSFNSKPFDVTIQNIKKIHSIAFKYSDKSKRKGQFKFSSNDITVPLKTGEVIRIPTAIPGNTDTQMAELVRWISSELENKQVHPVIVIGVFVYEYLSIHPFDNGNGRTARILIHLLLIKTGYSFMKYCSVQNAYNNNRPAYHTSLFRSQLTRGIIGKKEFVDEWVLFFVSGLIYMIKQLNTTN